MNRSKRTGSFATEDLLELGECLLKLGLLLLGEVRCDQLKWREVSFLLSGDAIDDRIAAHEEESGSAGSHLIAGFLNELVADANIGKRRGQRAHRRADGESQDRDEKDESEKHSPECA